MLSFRQPSKKPELERRWEIIVTILKTCKAILLGNTKQRTLKNDPGWCHSLLQAGITLKCQPLSVILVRGSVINAPCR